MCVSRGISSELLASGVFNKIDGESRFSADRFSIDATSVFGVSILAKSEEAEKMKIIAIETKELVKDVIKNMCEIPLHEEEEESADASQKVSSAIIFYMEEIHRSLTNLPLIFSTPVLETQFRYDFNRTTWSMFIKNANLGLVTQLLLTLLGFIQTLNPRNPCPLIVPHPIQLALAYNENILSQKCWPQMSKSNSELILSTMTYPFSNRTSENFIPVVLAMSIAFGLQFTYCGTYLFELGNDFEPQSWKSKLVMFSVVVICTITTFATVVLPWSFVSDVPLLATVTLPISVIMHFFNIGGVLFSHRMISITVVLLVSTILTPDFLFFLTNVVVITIWSFIFHSLEYSTRVDYLLDAILETQQELVEDETNKSAGLLISILPQRVILKLLANPNSLVFEEFSMMTVLHMDIAG
ncbi:hypothetical protein HK096_009106 [Nowakowskiella sp. JEL0078]|nr:hypothetical protein HK096_009106 [Nowakowskiella sp. JEL0078]